MTIFNGYEQSDREQKLNILNLPSLEAEAKKIIPTGGFGYISGGSEDEWTLHENTVHSTIYKLFHVPLLILINPQLILKFLN